MTLARIVPAIALLAVSCVGNQNQDTENAPGARTGQPLTTTSPSTTSTRTSSETRTAYDFQNPEVSFALPDELHEISGLTALEDGRLAAIQDEEGILFILNGETGSIEATYPFGDDADYEGVERVDDRIFILRSNGTIFELTNWDDSEIDVRTHETDLKGRNDTEGLGYDAASGRLLIACKEDPGSDLDDDVRAIYAYDFETGDLSSEPWLQIDLGQVEERLGGSGKGNFKPSAVAVHPTSQEVYVLSANDKALAVIDSDSRIVHVTPLDGDIFQQPEGLAFLPDGTLFISSEGGGGSAMLSRFSFQPTN